MSKYTPEQIKFLMQELSCFDSADIESDDFDVAFENEQGVEGFATCSIVRLAESAFLYMDQLEQQRDELQASLQRLISSDPHIEMFPTSELEICANNEALPPTLREQAASVIQARAVIAMVNGGSA